MLKKSLSDLFLVDEVVWFFWLDRKKRDRPVCARRLTPLASVPFLLSFFWLDFFNSSTIPSISRAQIDVFEFHELFAADLVGLY